MLLPPVLLRGSHSPLPGGGGVFLKGISTRLFPCLPTASGGGVEWQRLWRGVEDGSAEWISRGGRVLLRCPVKHDSVFIP